MTIEDPSPKNSALKFNNWCEKRGLVCSDENRLLKSMAFCVKTDLSPSEQAAFYLHELTGCEGLEFVAFSNVQIEKQVTLSNSVIIVPCFLNETELEGLDVQDPLLRATMEMKHHCRYVYDGWIPITVWDTVNVRNAVRNIDEALSVFSLSNRIFFEWEPKYPISSEPPLVYYFKDQEIQELEVLSKHIDLLKEGDRVALYRSIAWLSQSLRVNEPAARFLFLILSIESLARYIENEATADSSFYILKSKKLTRAERREKEVTCINDILSKMLEYNKTEAIRTAYFDCVTGIKQQLKTHLEFVFEPDTKPIKLLFEEKVEGFSLYELRNIIAHGTVDALSEAQMNLIQQRVWDAEKIARGYIISVLKKALHFKPSEGTNYAATFISPKDMVMSDKDMYQGPTHMAIIYS